MSNLAMSMPSASTQDDPARPSTALDGHHRDANTGDLHWDAVLAQLHRSGLAEVDQQPEYAGLGHAILLTDRRHKLLDRVHAEHEAAKWGGSVEDLYANRALSTAIVAIGEAVRAAEDKPQMLRALQAVLDMTAGE